MANTNTCASTALYESLVHCKGTTVLPGLRPHIFYIAKSYIVTFPTPPNTVPSEGSMGSLATISENFVLKADAKWKRIDIVASASNVNSESQGEAPSKTFNNTGAFRYPGNNAAAAAFCRQAVFRSGVLPEVNTCSAVVTLAVCVIVSTISFLRRIDAAVAASAGMSSVSVGCPSAPIVVLVNRQAFNLEIRRL